MGRMQNIVNQEIEIVAIHSAVHVQVKASIPIGAQNGGLHTMSEPLT
jgi:hypothetical protein